MSQYMAAVYVTRLTVLCFALWFTAVNGEVKWNQVYQVSEGKNTCIYQTS